MMDDTSREVKAALIGGSITFLLNAVVGVWVVSRVNTVQSVIQNELRRVRDTQTRLESDVAELEIQTSVLETRVNNYHTRGSDHAGTGTTITFPDPRPRSPSPSDPVADTTRRGQALKEEARGAKGTK